MRGPIIFLHTLDGRPLAVHVSRDKIVLRTVMIEGRKYDVRETQKEIADILREVERE
jgi:hypothetical protein